MNPKIEFENGIHALRTEAADPDAALRALNALRQPTRSSRWRLAGIPVIGAVALGAFLLAPRRSAASELDQIAHAVHSADEWMATVFIRDEQGKEVWASKTVRRGEAEKTTYNPATPKMAPAGVLSVTYTKGERIREFPTGKVVDKSPKSDQEFPEQLISKLADHALVESVDFTPNVQYDGANYDRYMVTWKGAAMQRTGKIAIYTMPGTKFPAMMVGVDGNSVGLHTEWSYSGIPAADKP